jgi:hypothetical protein
MSIIDKALWALSDRERETYISYLREVVTNPPGISGSGGYLGSIAPLVFATEAEKAEALRLMSEQEES